MPVQTSITNVEDLVSTLSIFDQIQVWRSASELGSPIPYTEITAAEPTNAILDGTSVGPWALSGLGLTITLNNLDAQTVTFTGTAPLALSQVIAKINLVFSGMAIEVPTNTNKLRLKSSTFGTLSSLLVSGTASAVLGLPIVKVNGRARRMALDISTTEYEFRDFDGLDSDWYKTRFYSSAAGTVSSFSDPTQGQQAYVLPLSTLTRCFAYLSDGTGQPIIGRRIIFVPTSHITVDVGGGVIYGSLPGVDRIIVSTDERGSAEVYLARGQTFRMFFEGTTVQREITIPMGEGDLNLLTALSTAADPFSIVQVPPIPIREA